MVKAISLLVYGIAGTGKSYEIFTFPDPIAIIDLEHKATDTHQDFFPDKEVDIFNCWKVDKNLNTLPVKSLKAIDETLNKIQKNLDKYNTIAIDNASKLVKFGAEWYKWKYNAKSVYPEWEWGKVYRKIKPYTDKVIRFSRFLKKHSIITAEQKDKYEPTGEYEKQTGRMKQEQVGYEARVKEFVSHPVSIIQRIQMLNHPKLGKVRLSTFEKHAMVGEVPLNLGFVDMTFKKLVKVHLTLIRNRKEMQKKNKNKFYKPRLKKLEDLFDEKSFNIMDLKNKFKNCIICGALIPKDSSFCNICGRDQKKAR